MINFNFSLLRYENQIHYKLDKMAYFAKLITIIVRQMLVPLWSMSYVIRFEQFDRTISKSIRFVCLSNNCRMLLSFVLTHFPTLSFALPLATFQRDPAFQIFFFTFMNNVCTQLTNGIVKFTQFAFQNKF